MLLRFGGVLYGICWMLLAVACWVDVLSWLFNSVDFPGSLIVLFY